MSKFSIITFSLLVFCLRSFAQTPQDESIQSFKKQLAQSFNDKRRADLLCKLALQYVYKPGENSIDLDSALLLASHAQRINASLKDQPTAAKIYFVESNALREKGDTSAGHAAINKSLKIYGSMAASEECGDAYIELTRYYYMYTRDGCLKNRDCYEKALVQFQAVGLKEKQADALKNLADYNHLLRNYGLAMINLQQALIVYTSIGHKALQGVYDLLGVVSAHMGDLSGSVQYGLLAVKTAEDVNDTTLQLCTIYHRLSVAYLGWSKLEEAEKYAKQALAIAIKYKDKSSIKTVLLNLCYIPINNSNWKDLLQLTDSADMYVRPWDIEDSAFMSIIYETIYAQGKEFKTASKYASQLIQLLPRLTNYQSELHDVQISLARYFIIIKQFKIAKKYINSDMSYSLRYAEKRAIAFDFKMAAVADSGMHNFEQALKNYEVYKMMSDSMLNETKSFQLAQMQVAYDSEKKDKDLKLQQQNLEVISNKNKLQELSLRKADFIRDVIIVSAILLISILIAGYKLKQRHNRKLEVQQKEISNQNILLRQVLTEQRKLVADKEWLVKEIHHRVKNNLQMIISLLNAQSEFLDHPSAIKAITESRERMQAISLIHQKLYQPGQGTNIDMAGYIRDLVNCICNSFPDTDKIKFNLYLENIELDVAQSVPLGLILNEAITNIVKYAFQKRQTGNVEIRFRKIDNTNLLLSISDNGKGLPADFDLSQHNSLGMQLIQLFTEQLEGVLHLTSNNGLEISLTFQRQYSLNKSLSLSNSD